MKKHLAFFTIILLVIALFGCRNHQELYKVMVPFGSPQLSQLYVQTETDLYETDVVNGAEPLTAALSSGSHDFIFAPTNLGAKMYAASEAYILSATIIWGNSYLVSINTKLNSIRDIHGKSVYAFGKNTTGDIVLNYILNHYGIVPFEINYLASVADAQAHLIQNPSAIVLSAEPVLSALKLQKNLSVLDLQSLYKSVTSNDSYPQASLFIKKSLPKNVVNQYLDALEKSIKKTNDHPKNASMIAVELGMNLNPKAIELSIPSSNIIFRNAIDSKVAINQYFDLLYRMNSKLIDAIPNDAFYYQR